MLLLLLLVVGQAMMLGEYGPYAKHFTKAQANYIAKESFIDEGAEDLIYNAYVLAKFSAVTFNNRSLCVCVCVKL